MRDIDMMLEPLRGLLYQIGAFLPRLLLALVILLVGWLLAKGIRFALERALRAMNLHVVSEKSGLDRFLREGGGTVDTVRILALLVYWLIILIALMIAFNSLNLEHVTELIGRVLLFVPRVILAILLIAFGAYFARFVGAAVTTYFSDLGMGDARLLWPLLRLRDHGVRRVDRARPARPWRGHPAHFPDHRRRNRTRPCAGLRTRRPRSRQGGDRSLVPLASGRRSRR